MTAAALLWRLNADGWLTSGTGSLMSPDHELKLDIAGTEWELSEFTDSDVAGVAVGRYQTIDEGERLVEVPEAIRCARAGTARDVEDDGVYEYAEQKGSYQRDEGEE